MIFAPLICIEQIGSELVEVNYQKYRKEMCKKNIEIYGDELIRAACHPNRVLQWTDDLEFYTEMLLHPV
jgi:hypothetical protein